MGQTTPKASPLLRRSLYCVLAACASLVVIPANHAAETDDRVELIRPPGVSHVMKAERGADGTIHLLFDGDGGPQYLHSQDGGATFSKPIAIVYPSAKKPGLEFSTWDMALDADGRVHVALGNNAWKLKLPKDQWGLFYTTLTPGAQAFAPIRNLNHIPSEGFSLTAGGQGWVTASFLSGKLYTMTSRDGGGLFAPAAELDAGIDPCKCCTTSTAYGPDGRLAVLYREESNNQRDIYLVLSDQSSGRRTRTRVSTTPWTVEACPMTYFSIRATNTGYVAAWPTKGRIYFARLDKNGAVFPPGEIGTPGTNGMRTGVLALSASDGATLVAWKSQDTLGWQLYDSTGRPQGRTGTTPSPGTGAAGVVLPNGRFLLFP